MSPILWHSVFFVFLAALACAFAVAVVLAGDVVRMAFYLIMSLAAVAGLFFLADARFLGAMQLMVYVGGTLVLLAFGVMLTARGSLSSMRSGGGQWILAALLGGLLLAVLLQTVVPLGMRERDSPLPATEKSARSPAQGEGPSPALTTQLALGLLGVRTEPLCAGAAGPTPPPAPAYLLVFEIISVHLLVVLVGAAYLARATRPRTKEEALGIR
ncbi:MAG: NADH-quinone oxidoreductase subunit J [Thermoguttaceae bacterium]